MSKIQHIDHSSYTYAESSWKLRKKSTEMLHWGALVRRATQGQWHVCGQLVTVDRPGFEARLAGHSLHDPSITELVLRAI